MRDRIALTTLCLALAAGVFQERVVAWGTEGHHIVARIAAAYLTPGARSSVLDLLGGDDVATALAAVSTWADEIRSQRPETYNWHFVDIPYDAATYDAGRDCKPTNRGDCVIAELARAQTALADHTQTREARQEALKFVVHFVGDLHQPLHCIDDHDRGGNDVHVLLADQPDRATNLHSVWDSTFISRRGESETAYADRLLQDLRAHPMPPGPVNVIQWAEESHGVAVRVAYAYPGFSASGPPASPVTLSAAYEAAAEAAIDRQLERGGVRLAAVLNAALD